MMYVYTRNMHDIQWYNNETVIFYDIHPTYMPFYDEQLHDYDNVYTVVYSVV